MAVFPRLRDVFGVPVDQIDAAAIERAIQLRAPESEHLDWKRDPYKRGSGDEIAKDIAGMANNAGGVIILGVEEDQHSRAKTATPFTDSVDAVRGMVSEIRQRRIRPFISDLAVTAIDAGSGQHFMVIAIGRSYDAPHAVIPESPTATALAFPMRQMTTTAWLKEDQVATMYRNRFAAHADVAATVDALMDEHSHDRWSPRHWVSVAVAPTIPGARAPGVAARTAEVGFAIGWAANREIPGSNFHLDPNGLVRQIRPAIGQTVVSLHDATLRLGHDGCAHVAQSIPSLDPHSDVDMTTPLSNAGGRGAAWGSTDEVEWALFAALSYAVDHAIDTGASGDLDVRAKLEVGTPAGAEKSPLGGLASYYHRGTNRYTHLVPDVAGMLSKTTIASATVGISDGANHRIAATAAYLLATDILAEFGIDEPRLFTYDGWVTVEHFGPQLRSDGAPDWATEHINIEATSSTAGH